MANRIRRSTHAGSWYNKNASVLNSELSSWLAGVNPKEEDGYSFPVVKSKAIIAPHAGYAYSGPTAAWAYKSIDTTNIKRIFILGPAHHAYIDGCALSTCNEYATPLGSLPLDRQTIEELKKTGHFSEMDISTDQDEHSIEMHLPYVRKIFEGKDVTIVPILVGAISNQKEDFFGKVLSPYLDRDDTFCVVSSDFCHWGERFSYTYYYPSPPDSEGVPPRAISLTRRTASSSISPSHAIFESITVLDKEAMNILSIPPNTVAEAQNEFAGYLKRTKNTICGRHPIGVLLGALVALGEGRDVTVKFVKYEHSSDCVDFEDSSVSYASAFVVF